MNWICQHCRSEVDEGFEVCWSCGATIDGKQDPNFYPEIEATQLPADGSRLIYCATCGYRGPSQRERAMSRVLAAIFCWALGLLWILFGIRAADLLTNHACPQCGETRQIYDWKIDPRAG